MDGDARTHAHTHIQLETHTLLLLSYSLSCAQVFFFFILLGVGLGSDVFKGISLLKLFFSSSPLFRLSICFTLSLPFREDRIERGREKERDIDKYF